MIWFRQHIHFLSRHISAGVVGVWLFAGLSPCVMAGSPVMPMDDCPSAEHATRTAFDAPCCNLTAVDCALPDQAPPTAQLVNDPLTPVALLIAVLPREPLFSGIPSVYEYARYLERIPIPPRGLRNTVLLI